jgi:hypothetical protein
LDRLDRLDRFVLPPMNGNTQLLTLVKTDCGCGCGCGSGSSLTKYNDPSLFLIVFIFIGTFTGSR